jgi:ABC-type transport system substrate-binding protein
MVGNDLRTSQTGRGVLAALLAVLVLAAACGGSKSDTSQPTDTSVATEPGISSEGTPQKGGKLIFAVTAETNGWNPALAQWADAGEFVGSSFLEPLFVYDSDQNIVPWLAESASYNDLSESSSINEVATRWTIKIRRGIKFHDGTEMTAKAVVDGILLAIREGLSKIALDKLVASIEVIDDYTFRVVTTEPWSAFLNVLAGSVGFVMAPSMLAKPDRGQSSPVGTGAFRFESWKQGESVKVRAFEDYWGGPCALPDPDDSVKRLCAEVGVPLGQRNGPYLDAIEFRPIEDPQQRVNALASGDVNMIMSTRAVDASTLKDRFQVVKDYNSEKTFVMLSTSKPPFNNPHARKALAYATDRQAILRQVSADEQLASDTSPFSETSRWGGVPPDQTGYPAYDPQKAREEIEAYKAQTGEPTLRFKLIGLPPLEELNLMQQLQEMWRQVGIETQLETIEQTAFIVKLTQGDFQAAMFRNYAYPDPDSQYVFWAEETAKGGIIINFSQYYSEVTENALRFGRVETDRTKRREAYQKLSRDRNEAVVDIWLYDTPYSLIAEPNVKGLNWFRVLPWGNFMPKPYITGLWINR